MSKFNYDRYLVEERKKEGTKQEEKEKEEAPVFSKAEIEFMIALRMPIALFSLRQTALSLGIKPHNVAVLIKAGILLPLGCPGPYRTRKFWSRDVFELAGDRIKLAELVCRIQDGSDGHNQPPP
jgi:hypothetical protein